MGALGTWFRPVASGPRLASVLPLGTPLGHQGGGYRRYRRYLGTYGTCYDMATYPCIYVYDAPGINPAAFGSYGAGIYIPKLGLVPKHVRPVRPVANLYDLLAS